MRLIDADKLADFITENEDDFFYVFKHKDREILEDIINRIPTVLDIDKVMEELTDLRDDLLTDRYCLSAHQIGKAIAILKENVNND